MNKPQPRNFQGKQSWGEIQLAIAAVAITATLGFWNLFSAGQKQEVAVTVTDTEVPPTDVVAQVPAPTPTQGFLPVKIIFGGTAPQQTVVQGNVSQPPSQPQRKHKPPVTTGSSKP